MPTRHTHKWDGMHRFRWACLADTYVLVRDLTITSPAVMAAVVAADHLLDLLEQRLRRRLHAARVRLHPPHLIRVRVRVRVRIRVRVRVRGRGRSRGDAIAPGSLVGVRVGVRLVVRVRVGLKFGLRLF